MNPVLLLILLDLCTRQLVLAQYDTPRVTGESPSRRYVAWTDHGRSRGRWSQRVELHHDGQLVSVAYVPKYEWVRVANTGRIVGLSRRFMPGRPPAEDLLIWSVVPGGEVQHHWVIPRSYQDTGIRPPDLNWLPRFGDFLVGPDGGWAHLMLDWRDEAGLVLFSVPIEAQGQPIWNRLCGDRVREQCGDTARSASIRFGFADADPEIIGLFVDVAGPWQKDDLTQYASHLLLLRWRTGESTAFGLPWSRYRHELARPSGDGEFTWTPIAGGPIYTIPASLRP